MKVAKAWYAIMHFMMMTLTQALTVTDPHMKDILCLNGSWIDESNSLLK